MMIVRMMIAMKTNIVMLMAVAMMLLVVVRVAVR